MASNKKTIWASIDPGKYALKYAGLDEERGIMKGSMRSKYSPDSLRNNYFGRGTIIAQIDNGNTYRLGNSAINEPDAVTSKKSEIHRIDTMAGIAMMCDRNAFNIVNAVLTIPQSLINNVELKNEYIQYILGMPEEEHAVWLKTSPEEEPYCVRFAVNKRYVYPEGDGIIYEHADLFNGMTGIIDIGGHNANGKISRGIDDDIERFGFTAELGGKIMVDGLADYLSARLNIRVVPELVEDIIKKPYKERYVETQMGKEFDERIAKESSALIREYMLGHVKKIWQYCNKNAWPWETIKLVFVGGTSSVLPYELGQIFGKNINIPNHPEMSNALGNLCRMCANNNIDLGKFGAAQ